MAMEIPDFKWSPELVERIKKFAMSRSMTSPELDEFVDIITTAAVEFSKVTADVVAQQALRRHREILGKNLATLLM